MVKQLPEGMAPKNNFRLDGTYTLRNNTFADFKLHVTRIW